MFNKLILITKDTVVKDTDVVITLKGKDYIIPDKIFDKFIRYICK